MAKDPVCGMAIHDGQARQRTLYVGEKYFFCSEDCKVKFESNPEKYSNVPEDDVSKTRKVVVVGTGQVGATISFALMMSGLARVMVLVYLVQKRAEGHAMDLNHGLCFVQPTRIFAGDYSDCRDADIVIVAAGSSQKPGETRLDLMRNNSELFQELIPAIAAHGPRILLIVSNPVDILTYVALKVSQYPMNRVMGSGTTLDTARFKFLLSRHCRVDPRNVHAYIIGEHGDSEVPVWSQANIASLPIEADCPACEKECSIKVRDKIFHQVKHAAYEIIDRKGFTNFAVALAAVRIVGSILRDENSVLTVSSLVDSYYGLSDVCLSIPTVVNINGIAKQIPINLDETERLKLHASAASLKAIIDRLDI